MTKNPRLILWGVIASPYQLKLQALGDYSELPWQRWPDQATYGQALGTALRLEQGRRRQSIERYPLRVDGMDEYPAVPYYSLDGKQFYYDSTGLARHLDALQAAPALFIPGEPELAFICQLIDEAFDEFGLYMVHHNRWVISIATNVMGAMTGREMRKVLPPGIRQHYARKLPARQVRRCPYLFSVAPAGYNGGPTASLTPPSREGFPPTHEILDSAWRRYLAAMEHILEAQPYLLGERFTLADASAYGQLSMNLVDGRAAELLEELAPRTYRWLCDIRDGAHKASDGKLNLSERLLPLLEIISETFMPLMRQNAAAYEQLVLNGQTLFNEPAFDRGEALYDGQLLGRPFRAVAKSFQVVVWRDLCQAWSSLPVHARDRLPGYDSLLTDAAFVPAGNAETG